MTDETIAAAKEQQLKDRAEFTRDTGIRVNKDGKLRKASKKQKRRDA